MWQKHVGLGFYDKRIEAYFKVFNSSQIHFVDGENMISRPWVEVEKIEQFLGVEKIVSKKFSFLHPLKPEYAWKWVVRDYFSCILKTQ